METADLFKLICEKSKDDLWLFNHKEDIDELFKLDDIVKQKLKAYIQSESDFINLKHKLIIAIAKNE